MIYLKLKKDLMTMNEALKNYNHKKFYHLKAFNRCIINTLKASNLDIDVYIDLKNTCLNPLAQFIFRTRHTKAKRYNRIDNKYFIVMFLHRIFKYCKRSPYKSKKYVIKKDYYREFKKTLYHELVHYKRHLQLDNHIIDILQYKKHDKILPAYINQNNIDILKSELLKR